MAIVTPIVPPPPVVAVVAPTPALKQARDPQAVKTLTARAIGSVRKGEDSNRTDNRRGDRGQTVDTVV